MFNARLDAERKAWDSLGRYKFYMFGYHAAAWVKYNQLIAEMDPAEKLPNPFTDLVPRRLESNLISERLSPTLSTLTTEKEI